MPTTSISIPATSRNWILLAFIGLAGLLSLAIPTFLMMGHNANQVFKSVGMAMSEGEPATKDASVDGRKLLRTESLDLLVKDPAECAQKIHNLAGGVGGFLVSSETNGGLNTKSSLTIRVPAERFEEALVEIKKLAARVESEKTEARDVTKQYVDDEAQLRNLQAEETQYLTIMKHATTVKDTLEVSEKLSDVRGQIEQHQAEFEALSKQVKTVAITVSLRAEADAQVFGLRWRPLYQLKVALRDGLDGLADYASTMASVVLYLPTILLWLMTILIGAALAWRILRWAARAFFAFPKPAPTAAAGS
jgi:hypothetical protein